MGSLAVRYDKTYVSIVAVHELNGCITPLSIKWPDGRVFMIDFVSDPEKRARCEKTKGYAFRYTVALNGKTRHLWRDENGWFVETLCKENAPSVQSRDPRYGIIPE